MDKTYNIPDNDNNIVAESDVAYAPAKNMPLHLDITLDENAIITDIKKAIQMIKGIVSVKIKSDNDVNNNVITPSLAKKIAKARAEYKKGETISCSTPEELQRYLDSL